jgi:pimeloyl-ACP methyl ester carboxylesterase
MQQQNNTLSHIYKSDHAAIEVLNRYKQYLRLWPVPNEQLYIPTREGKTFVVASGPKNAPALVLLHGTMSNATAWIREVVTWAAEFQVYAIDIIGDAGLSAPSRPSFSSDAHALWLSDVLDGLAVSRASFIGTSMGGGIALDYAIRLPERVDSLVLICPGGVADKNILWWALPLLLLGPWGARKVRERIIGKFPETNSKEAKQFAEFTDAIFKGMRPRKEGPPTHTDEQFSRLSMPVLVLLGGRDVTINPSLIKHRFEQHVSNAEVLMFQDARHYLGDQSDAIARFLRSVHSDETDGRSR